MATCGGTFYTLSIFTPIIQRHKAGGIGAANKWCALKTALNLGFLISPGKGRTTNTYKNFVCRAATKTPQFFFRENPPLSTPMEIPQGNTMENSGK
jgi:hypothetical protein